MKIVSVEVVKVDIPSRSPPFRWRTGLPGSEPELVGGNVRIETDEGLVGIAESLRGVSWRTSSTGGSTPS